VCGVVTPIGYQRAHGGTRVTAGPFCRLLLFIYQIDFRRRSSDPYALRVGGLGLHRH
jgi:hypothetical protein